MFTREELQDIRERAIRMVSEKATNIHWAHTYINLANAADHLDAMIARSTERIDEAPELV